MATAYFLCGLAASGKTTFAKKLTAEKNAVRLTLDERMIAKCDYSIFDEAYGVLAAQEKEAMWTEACALLDQDVDVVLDWSLWSRRARKEWTARTLAAGHTYRLYYLDMPFETLRQRLSRRNAENGATTHVIPLAELARFSQIFEPPTADEGLNLEVITVNS